MNEKRIDKDKVPALLRAIGRTYKLFAPVARGGNISFCEVGGDEDQVELADCKSPPKGIFFPPAEKLLNLEGEGWSEEEVRDEKMVIFGLRPCDCKSLVLLDKVFSGEDFEDPYYLTRRKNTLLLSLACNSPRASCFCTSFDCGPFSEEGADGILFELNDGYILKPLDSKGEAFVKEFSSLLSEPKKSDLKEVETFRKGAGEKVSTGVKLDKLDGKLASNFDHPVWNEVYEKCLGCGACTYLCPTCHCFDITDEPGERIRSWDSCQFPLFTLHASGHNPRPSGKERMRQRIMHKFSYCPENFAETFCVGCGRCVSLCPVNLDIRLVINRLRKEFEK